MDLILYNGKINTMCDESPKVSAVAIKGNQVEAVGDDSTILAMKTDNTKRIDLGGKCVVPGFNDSHMHLLGYAMDLNCVDLTNSKSPEEIAERIQLFITENEIPEGGTVLGYGWNQNLFESKEFPTRHDLDKASDKHIIGIDRACRHISVYNTLALKTYEITKNTKDVPGGHIARDENGEPTGVLFESARKLASAGDEKELDVEHITQLILKAAPNLNKMGITSIQSDDFSALTSYGKVMEAYSKLAEQGKLSFRVNQQARANGIEDYRNIVKILQTPDSIKNYYKIGPVKVMADGSLGARTAYMLEDYHDDPGNKGIPIYDRDELRAIITLAHKNDRQLAVHAIGDGAMAMVFEDIENCQRENPKSDIRHGIVHCQITDEVMVKKFSELNMIALIQPIFIHADAAIAALRVGENKASTSYAFKTMKNDGVHISFGTDCPVEQFNPFHNIYCAVTRKDLSGNPKEGFYTAQALTVEEAVYSYTAEGAYASFEEDIKGKIKPGMLADMVVLSEDIFGIEQEQILNISVDKTIFDGKIVFEK